MTPAHHATNGKRDGGTHEIHHGTQGSVSPEHAGAGGVQYRLQEEPERVQDPQGVYVRRGVPQSRVRDPHCALLVGTPRQGEGQRMVIKLKVLVNVVVLQIGYPFY